MLRARVLIADDDAAERGKLHGLLAASGLGVSECADGEDAFARLADFAPDLVVAEAGLPRCDAVALIQRAREHGLKVPFVILARTPAVEGAVQAMIAGADDYVPLQDDPKPLLAAIASVLHRHRHHPAAAERHALEGIVGVAPELASACEIVRRAAPTTATVLILGESGTGKDLFARAVHDNSPRKDAPFVAVSCASLNPSLLESELFGHEKGSFTGATGRKEGRFELASGGTLYLDEVSDIPPQTQVKLLRALQQREFERVGGTETVKVDVRLVAASRHDLPSEVRAGRFREDLYYRLDVVSVTLPPLRRRKGDIPALAARFIERAARAHGKDVRGLAPSARAALVAWDWPGNVRELENVMERAVVMCHGSEVTLEELPASLRAAHPSGPIDPSALMPGLTFADIEREAILRTLTMVGGSTARAAEVLGVSIRKIQYRVKEYGALAR